MSEQRCSGWLQRVAAYLEDIHQHTTGHATTSRDPSLITQGSPSEPCKRQIIYMSTTTHLGRLRAWMSWETTVDVADEKTKIFTLTSLGHSLTPGLKLRVFYWPQVTWTLPLHGHSVHTAQRLDVHSDKHADKQAPQDVDCRTRDGRMDHSASGLSQHSIIQNFVLLFLDSFV